MLSIAGLIVECKMDRKADSTHVFFFISFRATRVFIHSPEFILEIKS